MKQAIEKRAVKNKPQSLTSHPEPLQPTSEELITFIVAVLKDRSISVHDELPASARDYVEALLYDLAFSTDIQVWTEPEVASAALPLILSLANELDFDPTFSALRAAVRTLCTQREYEAFCARAELALSSTFLPDERKVKDYNNALKLARVLADPNTRPETRAQLEATLERLSQATHVSITHPALAERAFTLMCERTAEKIKGKGAKSLTERREEVYQHVHSLLDSIPDERGASNEQARCAHFVEEMHRGEHNT